MISMIRTSPLLLSLLLPFTAFAAQAKYELTVDGLACPFCAYGIEKELTRAEGVASIEIDINAGTVTVTMRENASLSEAKARQIVSDAGFTLAGFRQIE